jgi:hypothetical protein
MCIKLVIETNKETNFFYIVHSVHYEILKPDAQLHSL